MPPSMRQIIRRPEPVEGLPLASYEYVSGDPVSGDVLSLSKGLTLVNAITKPYNPKRIRMR
ncbi:MAG TPA: hypothetical protein PLF41_14425 [Anaerolineales bacterium]|nr:hypothetical protein [Anaerolineales bacterium]